MPFFFCILLENLIMKPWMFTSTDDYDDASVLTQDIDVCFCQKVA
jgi:hypothetical protein